MLLQNKLIESNNYRSNSNYETKLKNPADGKIPKYMYAVIKEGKLLGYRICFPVGINHPYIQKTFYKTDIPGEALELAKKYLEELQNYIFTQ
ncbi:MAG: hypothetical protein Hyperionvirus19_29 [Hyperionvirus sp.]|uniref:Uncharacterized protein n=1 Tax=Hyperionvirus sp. TaxID=2487770 RepID=A0A3G5AAE8_9VIRU|nr:MAG: hypothetical protein Hyperionvirus19_29 [Hyperionvirus sp.]